MKQSERLDILVRRFAEDSQRYRNIDVGATDEEKRVTLRSLMNIRMPRPMDADTLRIQDEYLTERNREKGIVTLADIPTIRESLGSARPCADLVSLWQGDITRLAVGAIVNAANSGMLGCFQPMHTCIDNCIHTFAGVELRLECERQMAELREKYGDGYEQPTAVPMLTPGYNLPAEHVVHIVGPIVQNRVTEELRLELAACYTNTLRLCAKNSIRSVAFCCISTGVFRFPKDEAAQIAVRTVETWLQERPDGMERVIFNMFGDADRMLYERLLSEE